MTIIYEGPMAASHIFRYDQDETGEEFQVLDRVARTLNVPTASRTTGIFVYILDDKTLLTNLNPSTPVPSIGLVIQTIRDHGFAVNENYPVPRPRP